ncbi:hypothetical protein FIU89_08000 [Roseovarius sp. THAF27]|uniref:DUF4214 domain-containing protein n=1 Tax=Roseovarius sp. THAF27 TaxID=2587850 RepID=UPI001269640E|nr:DUF4214 domain-containing protein [Roseovarius sp. THAF27]QFT80550.1 hypothetical protein FIU89_08000 [Roseovarius sp. THAF27]
MSLFDLPGNPMIVSVTGTLYAQAASPSTGIDNRVHGNTMHFSPDGKILYFTTSWTEVFGGEADRMTVAAINLDTGKSRDVTPGIDLGSLRNEFYAQFYIVGDRSIDDFQINDEGQVVAVAGGSIITESYGYPIPVHIDDGIYVPGASGWLNISGGPLQGEASYGPSDDSVLVSHNRVSDSVYFVRDLDGSDATQDQYPNGPFLWTSANGAQPVPLPGGYERLLHVSDDARYLFVAPESEATSQNVIRYDTATQQSETLARDAGWSGAGSVSEQGVNDVIASSDNNLFVLFTSSGRATEEVLSTIDSADGSSQLYLRDMQTDDVTWVSDAEYVGSSGGFYDAFTGGISQDGRFVIYQDLEGHVVLRDMYSGTRHIVSSDENGLLIPGASSATLSADGRFVAWQSSKSFVPNDRVVSGPDPDISGINNLFSETLFLTDLKARGVWDQIRLTADAENNIVGSRYDDVLVGNAAGNVLEGSWGDDTLLGDGYSTGDNPDEAAQIARLYLAALDRMPDATDRANWGEKMLTGRDSIKDMAVAIVNSPDFTNTYGALNNDAFVDLLYRNVLEREADQAGSAHWVGQLDAGASRAKVVLGFSESIEFKTNTKAATTTFLAETDPQLLFDDVFRLYHATLGRDPDVAGLKDWTFRLAGDTDYTDIVAGFVNSPEFLAKYGGTSDNDFVNLLYLNVLGRPADPDGAADWLGRLAEGQSRADIVEGFAQSQEFTASSVPGLLAWLQEIGPDDVLVSGQGADIMTGGLLSDVFVFDLNSDTGNRVLDFEEWDILRLEGFGYASNTEALAHMTQTGADVIFSEQGVSFVIEEFTVAQLTDVVLEI